MKLGKFVVAGLTLALAAGAACGQADIAREGSGNHRTACDKLELTGVPATFWSTLTDWTNGDALTAENTKDKAVLICTWWSAYTTSHTGLKKLQELSDKYSKSGLIVVGIHHDKNWDEAKKVLDSSKVTILNAHDSGNKLRSTLQWDQDPDFYVIDRAGNFRYVDVVTSSIDKAVQTVLNETAADAKALPSKLADAAKKATKDLDKTTAIAGDLKPGQALDVPFTMPEPDAYKSAKWPETSKQVQYAKDVQGSVLPVGLTVDKWLTKKPNTNGRVMVLDFWATWCGPCKAAMPMLDQLYKDNKQDLALIGISDESESTVSGFLSSHKHAYFQGVDEKKTLKDALSITAIPHCVIISSDGIVRWQGNPHDPSFKSNVLSVIAADPGVQARRRAEAEFLKTKTN